MTILFWPRRHADEPLPTSAGVVIGWKQEDIVIVAKILHHKDHSLVHNILKNRNFDLCVLGTWAIAPNLSTDHTTLAPSPWPDATLPALGPSKVGGHPWWLAREQSEQDDLLVYFDPRCTYRLQDDIETIQHRRCFEPGGFYPILKRLNQIDTIMESLAVNNNSDDIKKQKLEVEAEEQDNQDSSVLSESTSSKAKFLAHHSMLYQQLHQSSNYNLIPFIPSLFIREHGHRTNNQNRYHTNRDERQITLDTLFGVVTGLVMFLNMNRLTTALELLWTIYDQPLREAIVWLESFPVGFKLNVPLTQNMGRQLLLLLDYWHLHVFTPMMGTFESRQILVQILASTSLILGGTVLLALVVDLIQLTTLHLTLIHFSFAKLYQFQLSMLSSLWKLFRGKKLNPLRQRTDTMEYDSMQLLVGMLAFTFALFLFTTILVYHVFFGLLFLAVQPTALWLLHRYVRQGANVAVSKVWNQWLHPTAHTSCGIGVYLEEDSTSHSSEQSASIVWLRIIPAPIFGVLSDVARHCLLAGWVMLTSLVRTLVTGQRLTHAVLRERMDHLSSSLYYN